MRVSSALIAGILGCASPGALTAQLPQYTPPGSLALPRVPPQERVRSEAAEARWNLGPVRLDPRLWVRNVGYVDNVFAEPDDAEKESDLTGTLGAGLVAFANLGPKMLASAYLLPEIVWWQDLTELQQEQLNFGVGLFGLFNRLTTLLEARRDEQQRVLSGELLVPFDIRQDRVALRLDLDLRGPIGLFGSLSSDELRYSGDAVNRVPQARLETLDRDENVSSLGLSYTLESGLRLGLGAESSQTDFPVDPAGRSNSTLGPLLQVGYTGSRFDVDASFVYREVDFDGNTVEDHSELTGSGRLGWQPAKHLRLDLYGGRSLVYSVLDADTYFAEDRLGVSVGSALARRLRLRLYAETGTDDYDRVSDAGTLRQDDVTAYGGGLGFELGRRLTLEAAATRTNFNSNLLGLDRTVTVFRVGVQAGGMPRPW